MRKSLCAWKDRYRHRRSYSTRDITGKKTGLVPSTLLKRKEEESAIAVEWSANRKAVLCPCERRILDRCECVSGLKTSMPKESEHVSMQIILSRLSHDVHDTTC